ncbi:MAG: chorismate-binding protein, partial [Rhodobacteraceae bacterium]|nr:chorismate-binding protein [Paracoccaceae bacterium]
SVYIFPWQQPELIGGCITLMWLAAYSSVNTHFDVSERKKSGDDDLRELNALHPFESLRRILDASQIDLPPDLPASCCGLFGYLGYDMIRLIEDLPNINPERFDIPDARLVRPNIVAVWDAIRSEVTIVSPVWHAAHVRADAAYEEACQRVTAALGRLRTRMPIPEQQSRSGDQGVGEPVSEISCETFMSMVERAREYIAAGDIFQVVPSHCWVMEYPLPPLALYRSLRRTNPSPFMFYFNFPDCQIVGASPEILVRVFDNEVTIRPLAGTRPRGATLEEDRRLADDLLADEKERAEHLMLLDLGRNDVGRVSRLGTVRPTESFIIERYSHVMHIVSNVTGQLDDPHDALSALMAGLPAGTVSGAPKVRAMEIIDELECCKRGIYGGGIGYFAANGDMDMCIALRTGIVKDGKLYIQTGSGVVHDSDPRAEWQETVNKSGALVQAARDAVAYCGQEAVE